MTPPPGKMMVSARVPKALVARVDYAVRNTMSAAVTNRSSAIEAALEIWTAIEADQLKERLGGPKK